MKQVLDNPCGECPFRKKSLAGWLGPWTVETILQQAHGEGGLACHVSVAAVQKRKPKITDEKLMKEVHVCVGSIQHANRSCKSYRNPELRAMQDALGNGEEILNLHEFRKHHEEA